MATFYEETPITDPDSIAFEISAAGDQAAFDTFYASATEELLIGYNTKIIALKVNGTMTNDGITLKAVYSKLKDAWISDSTLIKFPFPMGPITDEQFEMINGWNFDKDPNSVNTSDVGDGVAATTTELLRTGGWQVLNSSGNTTEEWAGIISLGSLAPTDQVYYDQLNDETTDNTTNFKLKGKVNQAIQIYNDVNGTGVGALPDFNRRGYFKMFVREWKKIYGKAAFDDIGVTTSTFQAYRFPLTAAADLKVTVAREVVAGTADFITATSGDGVTQTYTAAAHGLAVGDIVTISASATTGYDVTSGTITAVTTNTFGIAGTETGATGVATVQKDIFAAMSITYAEDSSGGRIANADIKGTVTTGDSPLTLGDVWQDTAGRWFEVTTAGTIVAAGVADYTTNAANGGTAVLASYTEGEREISIGDGTYFAFSVIIDGDTGTAAYDAGAASTVDIYAFVQYSLSLASDINSATPPGVIGKTADTLLGFVGDTLVTTQGVYIDSFKNTEINSIDFTDYSNTVRRFKFTAFLLLNFGANLTGDSAAKYFVFFTNADAADVPAIGNFGTATAALVDDADGVDMTGLVSDNVSGVISKSYNYDGNVQRGTNSQEKDVPITAVAIGELTGQYVKTEATIARSKTNTVSLIAALERNYDAGSV